MIVIAKMTKLVRRLRSGSAEPAEPLPPHQLVDGPGERGRRRCRRRSARSSDDRRQMLRRRTCRIVGDERHRPRSGERHVLRRQHSTSARSWRSLARGVARDLAAPAADDLHKQNTKSTDADDLGGSSGSADRPSHWAAAPARRRPRRWSWRSRDEYARRSREIATIR